jgi:ATP-dependent Lon protease
LLKLLKLTIKGEKMGNFMIKGILLLAICISLSNAQTTNGDDIIEVVDYKIQRIHNYLVGDLVQVKEELNKLKSQSSSVDLQSEIKNLDASIENLEENIVQASLDTQNIQKQFLEYDSLMNQNSKLYSWIVLLIVITIPVAYFLIQNYIATTKEELEKNTQVTLKENIELYKEEFTKEIKKSQKTISLIDYLEFKVLQKIEAQKKKIYFQNKFKALKKKYGKKEIHKEVLLLEVKEWIDALKGKKDKKQVQLILKELQTGYN